MNKKLFLFFLIMFVIGTDTFLISPLLPTLKSQFGITTAQSGWLGGAYPLGYALFALIAGPISDSLNRKNVMIAGLLSFSVSTVLCGLAPNFAAMFAFRLLAGLSAAVATPQVWASIPLLVQPQQILKAMGIATAGLSISQLLGVPIGSYLAASNWSTPFYAIGGASLLLVLLVHLILPGIPPVNVSQKTSILSRYRTLFENPKAKPAFFAYFTFQTGFYAVFTFIGTWLAGDFGLSVSSIGSVILFLGLGNTIGSFSGATVVAKIGKTRAFLLGLCTNALILLLLPHAPNLTLAALLFFVMFLIGGLIFPLMMGGLQTLSATSRGTIAALSSATMYAGSALGSTLAGLMYAHLHGFLSVSLFAAVLFVSSIFLFQKSGIIAPPPVIQNEAKSADASSN